MDGNNSSWKQMSIVSISPTLKTQAPLGHHYSNFILSMIVVNALMAFMATSLNVLIILTFVKTTSLRETPSNLLVLGLAISDLSVGVFAQPFFCTAWICWSYRQCWFETNNLEQSFITSLIYYMLLFHCLTLPAITVDRFLAVHLHLRYQELVTTKRYGITLACIWIISIFTVMRHVIHKRNGFSDHFIHHTLLHNVYQYISSLQNLSSHSQTLSTNTSPTAINTTVHRHA